MRAAGATSGEDGSADRVERSIERKTLARKPGLGASARKPATNFARRDQHAAGLAAPEDLERHQLADAFLGQQAVKIVDAAHRLARKLNDQIAGTQLRFGRRRAF